jgi:predicted ATP-grasp superfamily ATP-dependent carboligase
MHFFLYEWCGGGGLVNEPGALPASLIREGVAMAGALAADLMRIPGARVTALRDPRVVQLNVHGGEIIDVQSSAEHFEEFERLAAAADATFLIAPEFDGILLKAARRAVQYGARLRSPSPEFIRLAADKHATCERLAAAGVPVPRGVLLDGDQKLPADFSYPAVLKPVDGAGSQDMFLVAGPHDEPPPYAWPRRLERYHTGQATSVAVLCGPSGLVPLVPCKQRISEDGRLRYLGGELPLSPGLAERANSLATRAVAALPATLGYVGVDMILGQDPTGGEDYVLEINPRLTTSYVGLRAATKTNLAEAMLRVAEGDHALVEFADRALEFDAAGNVSFVS